MVEDEFNYSILTIVVFSDNDLDKTSNVITLSILIIVRYEFGATKQEYQICIFTNGSAIAQIIHVRPHILPNDLLAVLWLAV